MSAAQINVPTAPISDWCGDALGSQAAREPTSSARTSRQRFLFFLRTPSDHIYPIPCRRVRTCGKVGLLENVAAEHGIWRAMGQTLCGTTRNVRRPPPDIGRWGNGSCACANESMKPRIEPGTRRGRKKRRPTVRRRLRLGPADSRTRHSRPTRSWSGRCATRGGRGGDIAFYVRPARAPGAGRPQAVSRSLATTFRLELSTYRRQLEGRPRAHSFAAMSSESDAGASTRSMPRAAWSLVRPDFSLVDRDNPPSPISSPKIPGSASHRQRSLDRPRAPWPDPEHGSSLWCQAVDPARHPGIGEMLVRGGLAEHFQGPRSGLHGLSVMHDNGRAIALYEKLGFRRGPSSPSSARIPINEKALRQPDRGL